MNEPVAIVWFDAGSPVGRRVVTERVSVIAVGLRKGAGRQQQPGKLHQPGEDRGSQ